MWPRLHRGGYTGHSVLAGVRSDHGRRGRPGLRGRLGFTTLPCTNIGHFRILNFTIFNFSLARLFLFGIGARDGNVSRCEQVEMVKVVTYIEDPVGLNSGADAFKGVAAGCGVPGFPAASADG